MSGPFFSGHSPFFTETVTVFDANNNPSQETFTLDTLASYSIISPALMQEMGLVPSGLNTVTTANGVVQLYVVVVPIQVRNYAPDPVVMMVQDVGKLVLGIDVIRRYNLLVQT